ncbi:MAG: InlB B-repeat-containing protein [Clostridia bacterium]|nr:InlB B-repeat-containing protein [Clostridia bacterium]
MKKVKLGEIVIDDEKRTSYAQVTFEESKNQYYVSLLEFIGNIYSVAFNANGGSSSPRNQSKYEGIALRLSDDRPTRLDYVFVAWNTKPEGNGVRYEAGSNYVFDEDVTLYAMWSPSPNPTKYYITYNLDGGSFISNPGIYTVFTSDIKLNNPTKNGYVFTGWVGTELENRTRNVVIKEGSRGDREYTAIWSEPVYVVDGNKNYYTLEDAIQDCQDNSTITVLKDIQDESEIISITKNLNINLNGHNVKLSTTMNNHSTLHIISKDNNDNFVNGTLINENGTCIYNKGNLQIGEDDEIVREGVLVSGTTGIINDGQLYFYDGQISGNKAIKGEIADTPEDYKAISLKAGDNEIVRLRQNAEYQARIGQVYYQTLAKAIDAVQEGETITLLMGLSLDNTIVIRDKEPFKLDLNGLTISTSINSYVIRNYSDVEIIDSSQDNTGLIEGINYSTIYNSKEARLCINNGTVNLKKAGDSSFNKTIYNDGGTLEINGGCVKSEANNSYAIHNYHGKFDFNGGTIEGGTQSIRNEDIVYKEPINGYNSYNMEDVVKSNDTYYFERVNDSLIPNNNGVHNSTANSYIELDYTDYDETEEIEIIINAEISSERNHDYGYATITESKSAPKYSVSEGRFIYISDNVAARDYSTIITGGKKYYLHLGYRKDGSVNSGRDCFTINSIVIGKLEEKYIAASFKMTGGTIDYSGIGIYNNSSKAIEITSGIIGIDDEVNIGTAIYNNKNANIDIKGNVEILSTSRYGSTGAAIYNNGSGTVTVSEQAKISSSSSWNGHQSYGINNINDGKVVINGGTLYSYLTGGYNGGSPDSEASAAYIACVGNQSNGEIIINGGNLTAESPNYSNSKIQGVLNNGNGIVTINGGIINGNSSNTRPGQNLKVSGVHNNGNGNIEVKGGTIFAETVLTSHSSTTYGITVLNSGSGTISIAGEANISSVDNINGNNASIGNLGTGRVIVNQANIVSPLCSVYSNAGTIEINNIDLNGTIQNEGGTVKIINTSDRDITIQGSSTKEAGIINNNGTIELGQKNIDNSNINVIGSEYGIYNIDRFYYYTGTIKGKTAIEGTISEIKKNKQILIEKSNDIEIATLYDNSNEEVVENITTGNKYNSLISAINDCKLNQGQETLKILKNRLYVLNEDDENSISILQGKNIKLDLNGNIIILGLPIQNNGTLEITNLTENEGRIVTANSIINNGTILINNNSYIENIAKEGKAIDNYGNAFIQAKMSVATNKSSIIFNNDNSYVELNEGADLNIDKSIDSSYGIYNNGSGNIKVVEGKITVANNNAYAIYNNGTGKIEIDGGILNNNSNGSSGKISSVLYNKSSGEIEVNGGTIYGYLPSGIINSGAGSVKITNTNIDAYSSGIYNLSTGTITVEGGIISARSGSGLNNDANGKIIVTGGTVKGTTGITSTSGGTIIIGTKEDGVTSESPEIMGGKYGIVTYNQYSSAAPTKTYFYDGMIKGTTSYWNAQFVVLEEEYEIEEFDEIIQNSTYKCARLVESDEVVQIEQTGQSYKSLNKAYKYCNESDDNTFTLKILKDCYLSNGLEVGENKNITLNLNENNVTLTIPEDYDKASDIINYGNLSILNGSLEILYGGTDNTNRKLIDNYGTLRIGNGVTISNAKGYYVYGLYNENNASAEIGANLTLSTISENNYLYLYYNGNNSNITINGGESKFSTSSYYGYNTKYNYGIYNSSNGNIRITNGIIISSNSGSSLYSYTVCNHGSGNVEISGGTVKNTGSGKESYAICNESSGNVSVTGGNIYAYNCAIYNKGSGDINIGTKDGVINSDSIEIKGHQYGIGIDSGTINFYDGKIKGIINPTANGIGYIEDDSQIFESEEIIDSNNYKVIELKPLEDNVARIEELNEEYKTLDGAIERAINNNGTKYTIKLLKDSNLVNGVEIPINKEIVLNINEHKIVSYICGKSEIINKGTFRVSNGFFESNNASGTSSENHIIFDNEGELIIDSTTTIENCGNNVRVIQNENNASVKFNGGNITADNYRYSNFIMYGLYNNGNGTILFNDGHIDVQAKSTIIESSANIYGIYNNSTGTIQVTDGEIKLHTESRLNGSVSYYGIYNKRGIANVDGVSIDNNFVYSYKDNASYAVPTSYSYGIYNSGTLNVLNAKIKSNLERITPCRSMNLNGYGIYNTGTAEVLKVSIDDNSTSSYGMYNSSILNIDTGIINSKLYGIDNKNTGVLRVGVNDGSVRKDTPSISSDKYGIYNESGLFRIYDGILKGKENSIYGVITETETNYIVKVFSDDEYECSILVPEAKDDVVAFVNGTYFETIQEAIDSCTNIEKSYYIEVVNGSTEDNITISENQKITLDMGGHSIISNSSNPTIINNGELQIVDTGYDENSSNTEMIANNLGSVIQNNGSKLIIGQMTENDLVNTAVPIIKGKIYGIENLNTNAEIDFYDGKIIGNTNATNGVTFTNIPEGYQTKEENTEQGVEISLESLE